MMKNVTQSQSAICHTVSRIIYTNTLCWTAWQSACQECHLLISIGEGIFCANFSLRPGPWMPCHRAWHRRCYRANDNGEFPIARPQDEEGELMVIDSKDAERFLSAQDGGKFSHTIPVWCLPLCQHHGEGTVIQSSSGCAIVKVYSPS